MSSSSQEEFDEVLEYKSTLDKNFFILSIACLPFLTILSAMILLFCFRKIVDFYLKRTILILIIAMALRGIGCSIMVWFLFDNVRMKNRGS